jgi:hypothetical protein
MHPDAPAPGSGFATLQWPAVMKRWVQTGVCALSAVLVVAALGLRLAPGWHSPADSSKTPGGFRMGVDEGALTIRVHRAAAVPAVSPPDDDRPAYLKWYFGIPSGPVLHVLGVELARWPHFQGTPLGAGHQGLTHAGTFWQLKVPLLLLAGTGLILPAVQAVAGWRRRAASRRRGHCRHCGYDLTGNVSGVCPECGIPSGASGERGKQGQKPFQSDLLILRDNTWARAPDGHQDRGGSAVCFSARPR